PFHNTFSSVLKRRSASCWLFFLRSSPLIFRKRESRSGPGASWPVESTESTSFCISASSIGKSRVRNFLGNSLNQKWPVASVPAMLLAYTKGLTLSGRSQGYANIENRSPAWPGRGKLRKLYLLTFAPDSVHDPDGVKVTSSMPP